MATRNNVIRLLKARGVAFEAVELPDDGKRSAAETAAELGLPAEQVFKTIVLVREGRGRHVLAVVPGPAEVDLKAVAAALREKKVSLPTQKEAERLTGLQSGGISALALLDQPFDVLLDEFSDAYDEIYVSGGQRGLSIRISVPDFVSLTRASVADISTI